MAQCVQNLRVIRSLTRGEGHIFFGPDLFVLVLAESAQNLLNWWTDFPNVQVYITLEMLKNWLGFDVLDIFLQGQLWLAHVCFL